ncbi:hypothetical protein Tco_0707604 [Tanacetum coccineum]|uniref:Uncharacterized protein n=1 Tax=Tanacetum coccineum TaxID=301880 RepID=A0ABQ4YCY8_9ASTR
MFALQLVPFAVQGVSLDAALAVHCFSPPILEWIIPDVFLLDSNIISQDVKFMLRFFRGTVYLAVIAFPLSNFILASICIVGIILGSDKLWQPRSGVEVQAARPCVISLGVVCFGAVDTPEDGPKEDFLYKVLLIWYLGALRLSVNLDLTTSVLSRSSAWKFLYVPFGLRSDAANMLLFIGSLLVASNLNLMAYVNMPFGFVVSVLLELSTQNESPISRRYSGFTDPRQLMVDIISHPLSSQNLVGEASTSAVPLLTLKDLTQMGFGERGLYSLFEDLL